MFKGLNRSLHEITLSFRLSRESSGKSYPLRDFYGSLLVTFFRCINLTLEDIYDLDPPIY